jgi:O-antigen/teichoic acid export membrane protein
MNLLTMVRNASANVVRVGVSILATLILPRLLLGTLSTEAYSVWVLIVQIGLYSSYLNLGISTIVGRSVAFTIETADIEGRNRIVSSGMAILLAFAALAMAGMVVVAFSMDSLFPDIPSDMLTEGSMTLLLVGSVIALRLPANIISSVFIGMQRNEFPLAFSFVEKGLTILLVFIVAQMGGSLFEVGIAYSLALLSTYVLEFVCYRRYATAVTLSPSYVSKATMGEIFRSTAGLAIWSFSSLLISGMDIVIVGAFDFQSVAAFSFAATLTLLVVQVQSSAVSVIMPVAATLAGRQDNYRLTSLLVRTTRFGVLALFLAGLPLIASSTLVITLWVGAEFVESTVPILVVLVIATIIRQSGLSFSMVVLGVGKQNRVVAAPLLGGIVNLVISILATIQFGAIGAAFGTVIGGMVEIGLHVFNNVPRIPELLIKSGKYFRVGFITPTLCALPGIAFTTAWMIWGVPAQHALQSLLVSAAVFAMTLVAGWFFAFTEEDRLSVLGMLRRLQARIGHENATPG